MNNVFKRTTFYAAIIATTAMSPLVMATNGYFAHGYGTKNKGLVGGGVALPQDAMIAATNPAGMVFVGERMDLGAAIFSPIREYTVTGAPSGAPSSFGLTPETVESDSNYFLIPHFAYNWMLNTESSVGVTVYGNGGMNTDYPASAGGGLGTFYGGMVGGEAKTGVNLEQLFINGTYARKINDTSSWGISAIFAYQRFEATGLAAFGAFGYSTDATNLTDKGTDTSSGFGAKLGFQTDVGGGVTLAGSYQSKIAMSEFDKYKGLFAEHGDFDIPATWTLGLAWKVQPKSVLTFDVQQIMYSDVAAVGNPMMPALGACAGGDTTQCLGADNGPGFGWEDMTIYKLGFQWSTSEAWTWRAGYSHGDQPIPSSEVVFNILAPAVMEDHFTFGFTRSYGNDGELNFAAMYAPESSVSGQNPLDPGQEVTLKMTQYELEASYSWKF